MGLLGKLLTLPVSGPLWLMQRVVEEAERQQHDEEALLRQLAELEASYERGDIDEAQLEAAEDEIVERLRAARARRMAQEEAQHPD